MADSPQRDPRFETLRCSKCGANLSGLRSKVCPGCGEPRRRRLRYFDRLHFDAVRAALDLAEVPYEFHDVRIGVIGMLTLLDGVNLQPVILIAWDDQRRAEEALDRAGLTPPVALIDREHPYCPVCGFTLRARAGECRCEVCNTLCAWFAPAQSDEEEDEDEHDAMERAADGPR